MAYDDEERSAVIKDRARPAILAREEVRDIHVKLAVLSEKLDRVLEDRSRITALEEQVSALKLFEARVTVWGIVGGGIWSLILTVIGIGVWK